MFSGLILTVMSVADSFIVLAFCLGACTRIFYAKGTHLRYVASTITIAGGVVWCIVSCIRIAGFLSEGDYGTVAFRIFTIATTLWVVRTVYNDDDNWFNDQWKRLKRGFKNFRQRLARAVPLPSPI